MLQVDVTEQEPLPAPVSVQKLVAWARLAYEFVQGKEPAEVSIAAVNEQAILELNETYRQRPSPTNVLAFPGGEPLAGGPVHLGDIVLCAGIIGREAREQHKAIEWHWAHMIIHGMLHLLGHDHQDGEEAATMERLEVRLLASIGIPDPYTTRQTG